MQPLGSKLRRRQIAGQFVDLQRGAKVNQDMLSGQRNTEYFSKL